MPAVIVALKGDDVEVSGHDEAKDRELFVVCDWAARCIDVVATSEADEGVLTRDAQACKGPCTSHSAQPSAAVLRVDHRALLRLYILHTDLLRTTTPTTTEVKWLLQLNVRNVALR